MNKIVVITRTKNRALLLERARNSIIQQSFRDFEWIIVNDGGEIQRVEEIASRSRLQGIRVKIINNESSMGMEAASNQGIKASNSEYIAIHDDDDSWSEDFLFKTITFLENNSINLAVEGVVTRAHKILEKIVAGSIQIKQKEQYNPDLETITLYDIAHLNKMFPPISFVYKRVSLEKVGLYREDLPVLGDWEFTLRFLRFFNIAVIPEYLANYHIRIEEEPTSYSNSISGDLHKHIYYASYLRNDLLRRDLDSNQLGIGFLVNICHDFNKIIKRIETLKTLIDKSIGNS